MEADFKGKRAEKIGGVTLQPDVRLLALSCGPINISLHGKMKTINLLAKHSRQTPGI